MIRFSKNQMLDWSFTDIETIKVFTQEDLPRGKSIDKPIWDRVVKNGDKIITEFIEDIGDILEGSFYRNISTITNIGNKKISFTGNKFTPRNLIHNNFGTVYDGSGSAVGILVDIEHYLDKRKFGLMREAWESVDAAIENDLKNGSTGSRRMSNAVIIPYHLQRHAMTGKRLDFNELVKWYCTAKESERNKVMSTIRVLCYDPSRG